MNNDNVIAVALGAVVCAVAIVGNVVRADAHFVHVYPNVASVLLTPLVVYVVGRRRRVRGESSEAVQRFGVRVGALAAVVFALGLGAFTGYWLGVGPLAAFNSVTAFGSMFVLSCFAGYAAGHWRIIAV